MKLNKNEKNYLLITLFKSYIFQSAICSVIIVICTAVLHTGLTWILDRYVEHYYLIYRGLYVYMTALIISCIKQVSTLILMEKILSQSVEMLRLYIVTQNCVPMQVTRLPNCVHIVVTTHIETAVALVKNP